MSTFKLVDWSTLHEIQDKLDKYIYEKKGIDEKLDIDMMVQTKCIALNTEICELYNELQFWKYWKEKNEVRKECALEEFVDCIHHIYSLANLLNFKFEKRMLSHKSSDVLDQMNLLLEYSSQIYCSGRKSLEFTFRFLLGLAEHLEFTDREIFEAYMKKNKENYLRQVNGY